MSFKNCININVPIVVPAIITICIQLRGSTLNITEILGINRTAAKRIRPIPKAAKRNLLLNKFLVNKTGLSDLQLKPCIKRERHILANAIVLPTAVLVCNPKRKHTAEAAAIIKPSEMIFKRNDFVRTDSLTGRGFSFITSLVWGSRPRAMAGSESVSRFINKR